MKLYYAPFACSFAARLIALEAEITLDLHRIELGTGRLEGGGNLAQINPMAQVPTLILDDGQMLTENAAVLTFLAEQRPSRGLTPDRGTLDWYRMLSWLSFVGTELHKKVNAPIFTAASPEPVREYGRACAPTPLRKLEGHLTSHETLLDSGFSVCDAYLFWALTILPHGGVSLDAHPAIVAYQARIGARPAVKEALRFERARFSEPFPG